MTVEHTINNNELIDVTQNAIINTVDSVAKVVETAEQQVSGHGGAFYENPEFWVGFAFVLVVVLLAKPIGKILNAMLNSRIDAIANRITEAQQLAIDAQKMLAEYEKKFLNAEKEAKLILRKSEKEIEFLKDERLKKMEQEMSIRQNEAELRIKTVQEEATKEITSQIAELALGAIKDVLQADLDKKAHSRLIDRSIDAIAEMK